MTDKAKQIRLEAPDDNGVAVVWIDMPDSKVTFSIPIRFLNSMH